MPDDPSVPSRVTIRVKQNGPYLIELADASNVRIVDAAGRELSPEPGRQVALCRCGGSATKPFCDKTHRRLGVADPAPLPESGRAARTDRGGAGA